MPILIGREGGREKERREEREERKEREGRSEREELLLTVECQMLKSKRGRDAAAGKSPLCNHHDKDWIRQEFSSKVPPHRWFISCKGENQLYSGLLFTLTMPLG